METAVQDSRAESIEFVLELGRALHGYGASAPDVEHAMEQSSRALGLRGEFFATPTSIFATFHRGETAAHDSTTHLMRVEPGSADLGRRARVDEVIEDVHRAQLAAHEGRILLAAIQCDPDPYPRVLVIACSALISASAARFFDLAPAEIAVAGGIGLLVELVQLASQGSRRVKRVQLVVSAFLAAVIVSLWAGLRGAPTPFQVVVAGLITLLPGLRLTTAMSELALDHLASGTARFLGSVMTLIALLFGAALGVQIGALFPDTLPIEAVAAARREMPAWTLYVALAIAPACFGVLFRALPRDLPWILASCVLAFAGARLGAEVLGVGFEAALGGLFVGLASNVYARTLNRPAATTLLPGILLLVPGSIGFKSLFNLLERDVITGIETAFQVATVGMSIVGGLFVANVIIRPRRLDRAGN
ncbi:MAG: threonine/serine exporter family protein [Planctomycetes bacterium]|nr:threonine/serine exporter family protein [Planctomycetota bacterium]